MPNFSNPFTGNIGNKKLSEQELFRAIRFTIAAEYEAVQLYEQIAETTDNQAAKLVLKSIAREEKVHAGELLELLCNICPDEAKAYTEGQKEVESLKV